MHRSELTVDLGAVRRNARTLLRALDGSQLWAVVKADAYGHGAVDVAGAVLDEGAGALCVATVAEGLELRAEFSLARILVMGPTSSSREIAEARDARLELVVWDEELPDGVRVHLKLDTGMGRWGLSELPALGPEVVGLMTHLATADSDPAFAEQQVERFRAATEPYARADATRRQQRRGAAAALGALRRRALRGRALRALAVRRGPGRGRARAGALLAQLPRAGQAARSRARARAIAAPSSPRQPTWIGIVPVGYADGFRRDLTGTEVRVSGEPRRVVGVVSMDAFAVELEREEPVGAPVTILGHGVLAEAHARVAETINYELTSRINSDPRRARRVVVDA